MRRLLCLCACVVLPALCMGALQFEDSPPLYLRNTIQWHYDQYHRDLERMWGFPLTFPVIIQVRREYSIFTRAEALFDGTTFRIALPPTLNDIPQLMKHEMMHLFTFEWIYRESTRASRMIDVPLWIMEGLACWYENRKTQRIPRPLLWNETDIMSYETYPPGDQVLIYYELVTDFFYTLDREVSLEENLSMIFERYIELGSWTQALLEGEFSALYFRWRLTTVWLSWVRWFFTQSVWTLPAVIMFTLGIVVWRRSRRVQDTFDPALEKKFGREYWKTEKSWYNSSRKGSSELTMTEVKMKPFILGHRGFSHFYPENTMLAFDKAMEAGADGIELDVRMSKDHHVMVIHDSTIDRVTGTSGTVGQMSLDQLKACALDHQQTIPTLDEVLSVFSKKAMINVELKEIEAALPAAQLVKKWDAAEQVVFSSFIHDSIPVIRSVIPQAKCGLLVGEETREKAGIDLKKPDTIIQFLQSLYEVYQPYSLHLPVQSLQEMGSEKLSHLRQGFLSMGLKIFWWTIDDPDMVLKLVKEHLAYGIITNHVEAIVQAFD